jgi:hypothetical protein
MVTLSLPTLILGLPFVFGDITICSLMFDACINSLNRNTMILGFMLELLSVGVVTFIIGGSTSLAPPVGVTGLAH